MRIEVWCNVESTDDAKPWTVSGCHNDGEEHRCFAAFAEHLDAVLFARLKSASLQIEAVDRHRDGSTSPL